MIEKNYNSTFVKRVIIIGDYNDGKGSINFDNCVRRFDKDINIPLSCCDDSNYQYRGDYILDSNERLHLYFWDSYKL